MLSRRVALSLAVASVLGGGAMAQAAGVPTHKDMELSLQPMLMDVVQAAPDRPVMAGLKKLGGIGQFLQENGFDIRGHVEGSFTYNTDDPESDVNSLRVFDVDHNEIILNQASIKVTRTGATDKFDVGGTMEWIYGGDARFIHANGLFDYHNNDASPPDNQWDLTQMFLTLNIPAFDKPLSLMLGKFVTPFGYETIDPETNLLYSHSFSFNFGIPFTHTGAMLTAPFGDLTAGLAVVRGWDQASEDNNGSVSYMGTLVFQKNSFKAAANVIAGPEATDDNSHWRVLGNVVVELKLDKVTIAADAIYGFESNAAPDGDEANWYGIVGYVGYKISDYVSVNGRAEWFRDNDGVRVGLGKTNYYEGTLGLTITPFAKHELLQNLVIRPEFRYDWSTRDVFDGGQEGSQMTAAIDVIVKL